MNVYEITGYQTGVSNSGVNYLQPADSFQNITNGLVYRQVLQSRKGVGYFASRLADNTRIFGIFEHIKPDSSKELLAVDQNFLYRFNTATGVFDPISFAGTMAGYGGFNISAKDLYVSGTSYPNKDNAVAGRFIFTSPGFDAINNSKIFFYNGTDVRDYTSVVDNPDFADPSEGDLTEATYILWFNERLNFIKPVINGTVFNQGILYSGIRTVSGNGDKYNVAGSGLFQADTYLDITGATIMGQILVINFNRMAYTMEKTTDAFNPYFGRAVPGVLGTNANFSAVSWDDTVQSVGKTGFLSSDGRQNLRTDNKIPNFTREEIRQTLFNLTYGGFDRVNNQFLWAYKASGLNEDEITQDFVVTRNYEENTWSVYDQRFSVLGQTDVGLDLAWDDIEFIAGGNPSWDTWDTTEDIWNRIGLGAEVQKTLAGDDLGNIYDINVDYDDFFSPISAVTLGNTTTLTMTAAKFLPGDLVVINGVEGMLDVNGDSGINNFDPDDDTYVGSLWTVLAATATTIEINLPSLGLSAYTPNTGIVSKVIEFYAETIPFNPYRDQGRRVFISHVEFLIDNNGGSLKVDVYADEEETPFKQNVLLRPDSDQPQAREWITMTVDQEANFLTFVLKQTSPSVQLRLTSMRLHCMPGGMTSA